MSKESKFSALDAAFRITIEYSKGSYFMEAHLAGDNASVYDVFHCDGWDLQTKEAVDQFLAKLAAKEVQNVPRLCSK